MKDSTIWFIVIIVGVILLVIWDEWNEEDHAFNRYVEQRKEELRSLGFDPAEVQFPKEEELRNNGTSKVWMYEFHYEPNFRCENILVMPRNTDAIYICWSNTQARFLAGLPVAEVVSCPEVTAEIVYPRTILPPPTKLRSHTHYPNIIGLSLQSKAENPHICTVRVRQLRANVAEMLKWSEDPFGKTYRYVEEDFLSGQVTFKVLMNYEYDPPLITGSSGRKYR